MNRIHHSILPRTSASLYRFQQCRYCFKVIRNSITGSGVRIPDVEKFTPDKIRNFGIVAHVDHGKSTLSDRLLQLTNVIPSDERAQFLDKLQVERERGITVKAQTCSMIYKGHLLNLIDTPGHVDFNFEVTRSLAACNGVLLLVAANEGVKAQTRANFKLAFERDLTILPVINKIDLKSANVPMCVGEIEELGFKEEEIFKISARSGEGVAPILDSLIESIPSPDVKRNAPLRALVFDSWFLQSKVIPLVFIKEGSIKPGQRIRTFHGQKEYQVNEVGIMYPDMQMTEALYAGQVGYIRCHMKSVDEASIGETIFEPTEVDKVVAFPGFQPNQPTVYSGLFPYTSDEYEGLEKAIEKLRLNDPSVSMTPDHSPFLGVGFKMGFLGMLHMEVFGQRLKDEYDADVILTAPTVRYKAKVHDNETIRKKRFRGQGEIFISDPKDFPSPSDIESFYEPMTKVTMEFPSDCYGSIDNLCQHARGIELENKMLTDTRRRMVWKLPDAEIMVNFFELLKSLTSGEVKFDQEPAGYQRVDLIKVNVTINDKRIEEFSVIVPTKVAHERGKEIILKLKEEIPKQQYEVVIKATVGDSKKALTSVKIPPLKKDFASKMKGNLAKGRIDKLLKNQREGKARMKLIGNVQVPKEAFINVIRRDY